MPKWSGAVSLRKDSVRAGLYRNHIVSNIERRCGILVELDQFKYTLSTYEKPLYELRDSL